MSDQVKMSAVSGKKTLLETGKYSDFTITVNERQWRVHKSVLCTQSEYFDGMCGGSFKVS